MEDNLSYLFNDRVGFKENAVDAFNRLRVSQPFTLFDSQHRYRENDKWSTITATGGTAVHSVNESTMHLSIGLTTGSLVHRETKRVFPYQPGKSLLVLNTFVMNQPRENLRQRIGYFGEDNGIYFEHDGLTAYMVTRSKVTGTVDSTTRRIPQSEWNGDTFDGNGASGRVLSVTGANIFWTDIEWLGVGDVRTGFFVDGEPVVAHTFHNDNINPTTYMTTAVLPIRYEIESIGAGVTGPSITGATMKQICSTVISEAGYEGFGRKNNATTNGTPKALGSSTTTFVPVVSIRMNENRLDSVIVPATVDIFLSTNGSTKSAEYRLLLNSTLTNPSWTTHANGNVDYDMSATAISATGTDLAGGFLDTSSGQIAIGGINNFANQLGRTQRSITGATGSSDIVTLAVRPNANGIDAYADFAWYEIV